MHVRFAETAAIKFFRLRSMKKLLRFSIFLSFLSFSVSFEDGLYSLSGSFKNLVGFRCAIGTKIRFFCAFWYTIRDLGVAKVSYRFYMMLFEMSFGSLICFLMTLASYFVIQSLVIRPAENSGVK